MDNVTKKGSVGSWCETVKISVVLPKGRDRWVIELGTVWGQLLKDQSGLPEELGERGQTDV